MAKRNEIKYLTMTNPRHGILWWTTIGFWWRPLKYLFFGFLSGLLGFKKLRVIKPGRK